MKTVLKLYFIISSMFISFYAFSQSEKIDTILMETKVGEGISTSIRSNSFADTTIYHDYKGYPQNLEAFKISFITYNINQRYYERFLDGKMDKETYLKSLDRQDDTFYIYKGKINHKIGVYTGLKGENKIVIVDANNNHDFSDDKVFKFDTAYFFNKKWRDVIDSLPNIQVNYEVFNGFKIKNITHTIKLQVYNDSYIYKDDLIRKLSISFIDYDYKSSFKKLDNSDFKFEMSDMNDEVTVLDSSLMIDRDSKKIMNLSNWTYKKDEEFVLNGNIYAIVKISHFQDTLFLKHLGKGDLIEGSKIGRKSIAFCKKDVNDSLICSKSFRKKYILLDFWGTWCNPCIASIPDLKRIRDSFSVEKLEIISVAADNNLEKVKEFVKQTNMNWTHLQQLRNAKELDALTNIFDVNAFPTTILIDEKGIIVERGSGSDFVEKLYDKIKIMLKEE